MSRPEHRIQSIETFPLRADLHEPFGNGQGWTTSRQHLIVRIASEEGAVGYGECWGPLAGNDRVVEEILAPILIGADPLETDPLWTRMLHKLRWAYHSFAPYSALSGVDVALWDLKGRLMGVPVHTLLGGSYRGTVPAYATGHYFRKVDSLEDQKRLVLEEAHAHLEAGFGALKVKIGLGLLGWGVGADMELMSALRRSVGPDVPLMADANCSYDYPDALRVGRGAESLGYEWLEEPLPPDDLEGYARLSTKLDIPIAAGESWALLGGFTDAFGREAVGIAQPDVCSAGGITETKRIVDLASALNVRCVPHAWGTSIALAATVHVLAAMPREAPLEYDRSDNPVRDALAADELGLQNDGRVTVPSGPGLGIEINEEYLRAASR